MEYGVFHAFAVILTAVALSACVSTSPKTMHAYAPLPPQNIEVAEVSPQTLANIQPAMGHSADVVLSNQPKKSCSFSSFHSRNTFGYELDESRHIAFKASPKVDVWNPADSEIEFSLRFTKSLGGAANKRPKCVY